MPAGWTQRLMFWLFPLPAYLLAAAALGLALWPAFLLVYAVNQWTAAWPVPLHLLTVALACGVGYFVFGLTLLAVIVIVKRLTFVRSPEGSLPLWSPRLAHWVMLNGMLMMAWVFFLQFTRLSMVNVLFYRLLGMKVGRDVLIDTVHMYDVDLIEIGDRAVIGGDAIIMAHVFEFGSIYYKRTRIGAGAVIGYGAVVLAGADVGDGAVVGAKSLVLKNTVLPPGTVWGGVPVRQLEHEGRLPAGEAGEATRGLSGPPR
jgi:serine acetyltransferase